MVELCIYARDREPLGGISRVENLNYDEGGSLGEKSGCVS